MSGRAPLERADIDFAALAEPAARILLGEPNHTLSSERELRYGTNGSLSINLRDGTYYDHEAKEGGGTLKFIQSQIGCADHRGALEWLEHHGLKEANGGNHREADIPYDAARDPFKNFRFKKESLDTRQWRTVQTWPYVDETGQELFQVCRLENGETAADGKPVKTYRQRHKTPEGYVNKVKGIRQVPYRLPELIEAIAQEKTIFIAEGEKCVDALIEIGAAATCNPMGAKNWPDGITPHFRNADVVILPDNDDDGTGADHAHLVAKELQGIAKLVRILELPGLPLKGDIVDWLEAGGTKEKLFELVKTNARESETTGAEPGEDKRDGPLPLFPPLPDSEPYPLDALGPALSRAAKAIANSVQVPPAMAAQSVLAAASLASCAHADVMLPYGQRRPLSLFFATVAATGDRKSTADNEALWPIHKREKALRDEHDEAMKTWRIEHAAWAAEKRKIEGKVNITLSGRRELLTILGAEPTKPLEPMLVDGSPTIEGIVKNWTNLHPALGIFTAEGGIFTGGHAMNDDNRLKTAAALSELWDGKPVKRVRATDGVSIFPGRRLAMHIMIQPGASGAFLCNEALRDQGLLSRVLVAQPESLAGTRLYLERQPDDTKAINAYGARLLSILETEPTLAEGKRNQLEPRVLSLSPEASAAWKEFHDHVETQCGKGGNLSPIKDFAAKAAEHAARIAGVIAIVEDIYTDQIGAGAMHGALTIADWYLAEACRLQQAGMTNPRLRRAKALLEWLQARPDGRATFREILRLGPNQTRSKDLAEEALAILKAHNWIVLKAHNWIVATSARPHTVSVAML
jgi:Protein of unknown function (DUF3987)